MRGAWVVLAIAAAACGGGNGAPDAPVDSAPDGPSCEATGAIGQFVRRTGNPRLIAGATFGDGKLDTSITDPDLRWDDVNNTWQLYYAAGHAMTYSDPALAVIRHATSADRTTWTVDDTPVLTASSDPAAWDHATAEAPTVAVDPSATPDRRYIMIYAGASGTVAGTTVPNFSLGVAFSSDGRSFSRVPASESPHAADGLVLTGTDVYPGAQGATASDPELVVVDGTYHLWFSSFACNGTNCATVVSRGVAHATSSDGVHWTVHEAPVQTLLRASADPTSGGGQPSVIYDATHCRWEIWLSNDQSGDSDTQTIVLDNMAGVWHADSTDGVDWHINYAFNRDLIWSSSASGEHLGLRTGADVGASGSGRLMLFTGFDDQNVPSGFTLPDHASTRPAVMTLQIATRDLP